MQIVEEGIVEGRVDNAGSSGLVHDDERRVAVYTAEGVGGAHHAAGRTRGALPSRGHVISIHAGQADSIGTVPALVLALHTRVIAVGVVAVGTGHAIGGIVSETLLTLRLVAHHTLTFRSWAIRHLEFAVPAPLADGLTETIIFAIARLAILRAWDA